jgi:3-dehydroquinate synthase
LYVNQNAGSTTLNFVIACRIQIEKVFHIFNLKQKQILEKIIITTPDSVSGILVGGRWEAVGKLLPARGVVIITDENVFNLYGDRFPRFPVLKLKPGEISKQLIIIESLAKQLLINGIDRSGFVLAVGGGVVCDVAGFLASVYMRGIRFGFVSTSLLSQVDASTGGKNAVNLGEIKNVIGTFRQPEFVVCDTTMLRTLPEDEYLSGLSELIKTGIIGDKSIIGTIEKNAAGILRRDRDLLSGLVARAVRIKGSVVSEDEKETGPRRVLNFGHTYGHAIELHEGLKHGFAVAAGMELATGFSLSMDYINKKEHDRIIQLLRSYNLTADYRIPAGKMEELITHDKKKSGADIYFVFIKGIGKPFIRKMPVKEVVEYYKHFIKGK